MLIFGQVSNVGLTTTDNTEREISIRVGVVLKAEGA